MGVRKEIRTLTSAERLTFINAVLALKANGTYDTLVHTHHHIMVPTVYPYEPQDPDYRNAAHMGPGFLPWHRKFLLVFEAALDAISPGVTVPYWDWTLDAPAPLNSPVFGNGFFGGDGDPTDQYRVQTGPFADRYGNWPVPPYPEDGFPGPGLKRQFGIHVSSLPTVADVKMAMNEFLYDEPNFNGSPYTRGFRNRLEGWITQRGDPQVTTPGSQLHNRVHLWIGGNMLAMTSPEDPLFFLHHCFIDKIWADWQAQMMLDKPQWAPHYCPMTAGPPGHNYGDVLKPWTDIISAMMDIAALGYSYAPSPTLTKSPFKSPFSE
jgi:tyrosinase